METDITFYKMDKERKHVHAYVAYMIPRKSFGAHYKVPIEAVSDWLRSFSGRVSVKVYSNVPRFDLYTDLTVEVIDPRSALAVSRADLARYS